MSKRAFQRVSMALALLGVTGLSAWSCSSGDGERSGAGEGEHTSHDGEGEGVVKLSAVAVQRSGIRTAAAEQRALRPQLETTGRVDFDQTRISHVSPRVPGRITELNALLGDQVQRGDVLAIIDSTELGEAKAEYLRANAQLALAKQNLEREEKLLEEKITPEKDVLEARAAYQSALADQRAAHQKLELLGLGKAQIRNIDGNAAATALFPLRAPIAGRVVDMHAAQGEVVEPDAKLYTIGSVDEVWIWLDVYERSLADVHLGDVADIRTDAYPDRGFEGTVSYIGDTVDPKTRAVRARVDVPNDERLLKPGMFARVLLSDPHASDGGDAPETTVVPAAAVQRDGDREIVFVQREPGHYERRVVQTGTKTTGFMEVTQGVAPGETVVVDGAFVLKSEAGKAAMGGGHSH